MHPVPNSQTLYQLQVSLGPPALLPGNYECMAYVILDLGQRLQETPEILGWVELSHPQDKVFREVIFLSYRFQALRIVDYVKAVRVVPIVYDENLLSANPGKLHDVIFNFVGNCNDPGCATTEERCCDFGVGTVVPEVLVWNDKPL
jgi:hypothetical protein